MTTSYVLHLLSSRVDSSSQLPPSLLPSMRNMGAIPQPQLTHTHTCTRSSSRLLPRLRLPSNPSFIHLSQISLIRPNPNHPLFRHASTCPPTSSPSFLPSMGSMDATPCHIHAYTHILQIHHPSLFPITLLEFFDSLTFSTSRFSYFLISQFIYPKSHSHIPMLTPSSSLPSAPHRPINPNSPLHTQTPLQTRIRNVRERACCL